MLRVVLVEYRLFQERRSAQQPGRNACDSAAKVHAEQVGQGPQVSAGDGFVQCDANRRVVYASQVQASLGSSPDQLARIPAFDHNGVEESVLANGQSCPDSAVRQHARLQRHAARNPPQSLWPVPDRVESRDHGKQDLSGADIGCRLFPPYVLLAGLQRQPHRRLAERIQRNADQPAWHRSLKSVTRREEARMWAAKTHGNPEALRRSHNDIRAHLARGSQQRQRQWIGRDDCHRTGFMRGVNFLRQIAQGAGRAGILQQQSERVGSANGGEVTRIDMDECDTQRLRPRRQYRQRLRVHVGRHRQHVGFRLADRMCHGHRFRRGRRLVQQRSVCDRHAGQLADHRLEVQQRLQPALRDLRLIGRISGVPARVLQDVAQDHRRRDRAVIPHADQ
jgi:hypothetical protein